MKLTATSVQFTDEVSVLKMYDNNEAVQWAIFHGTQLMSKYQGKDEHQAREKLKQFLTVVQNSAAVYTVKLYEKTQGKITNATTHDCSYNFKLLNDTIPYNGGNYILQQMEKKFTDLQQEIVQLRVERLAENEDDEEPQSDWLGGLGKIPGMNEAIAGLVRGLVSGMGGQADMQNTRIGIAGVTMNEEEKLTTAMAILAEVDPQLPDHLYKLAMVAKKDPVKFQNLLQVLTNL
jgi:hypothetical protein